MQQLALGTQHLASYGPRVHVELLESIEREVLITKC